MEAMTESGTVTEDSVPTKTCTVSTKEFPTMEPQELNWELKVNFSHS